MWLACFVLSWLAQKYPYCLVIWPTMGRTNLKSTRKAQIANRPIPTSASSGNCTGWTGRAHHSTSLSCNAWAHSSSWSLVSCRVPWMWSDGGWNTGELVRWIQPPLMDPATTDAAKSWICFWFSLGDQIVVPSIQVDGYLMGIWITSSNKNI